MHILRAIGPLDANAGHHESSYWISAHLDWEQMEAEVCAWFNTSKLARNYSLSRDSLFDIAMLSNSLRAAGEC
jgi:hypothetical protein